MKPRFILFLKTYLLMLLVFVLQKPLFMWYYGTLYADATTGDWLSVMVHGLPLDLSLAGYFTAIPGLMLIASVWTLSKWLIKLWKWYFIFVMVLLSVIFVVDLGLYEYWGFRLDSTPLFYFFSSPKDAFAGMTPGMMAMGVLALLGYAALLDIVFHVVLLRRSILGTFYHPFHRTLVTIGMVLLTGLLFIPIRGGFTVSTMNTGKVYFSANQRLNHAAINPAFSLMESLSKQKDFGAQYRFMEPADADRLFGAMLDGAVTGADTASVKLPADTLLRTQRPDILLIILESFSSRLMSELGGEPDVTPNLDSLSREGVLFTNFYANSFRTDRGLVSILSGYPAQPTTSLMKYPRKTQSLPAIAGSLRRADYATHYYYGGDADFTNMRSYLMSSGFETVVCDSDFPLTERLSKWGAHDHVVFQRLIEDLQKEAEVTSGSGQGDEVSRKGKPAFRVFQTSSSHEPFEVPYERLQNERLNAFAYTDSCVGDFVRRFRRMPQWENTLIVLVPDHVGCYPEQLDNFTVERYQIPLLMIGGAVRQPRRIDVIGSQQDLAATLLAQLGLPHGEFTFSKDMLSPASPHFAFFAVPDAFGMVTPDNRLIFDCRSSSVVLDEGTAKGRNLLPGQAYLQKLYDDIAGR